MTTILSFKPFRAVTLGHIFVSLLVCSLLTLGILYELAARHRSRARAFLRDFAELKVGKSTFADAQGLAREYGGIPWYVTAESMRCTFENCVFAFRFDNLPLSYVPLVHYTAFYGFVRARDGVVVGREMNYERLTDWPHHFSYVVYEDFGQQLKGWEYGVLRLKVDPEDPKGIPHVLEVRLGPASTEGLRRRAYSLDLSCLASFYGCGSPSAIYPAGLSYEGPPYQCLVPNEQ